MKIDIALLVKNALERFEAQEELNGFAIYEDAQALSPIRLHTKAWYEQQIVHVHLIIEYRLRMVCSRCLSEFEYEDKLVSKEKFTIEQLATMHPSGIFNSMQLAREAIILKIPMKKLCESTCEGLVYKGFTEEWEDEIIFEGNPHFDKLKELLEKADKEV